MSDLVDDISGSVKIMAKLQDDDYAVSLYRAFCNVTWVDSMNEQWSASWRCSGGLIAGWRNKGENYMNFYCSGGEGKVSEEIATDLAELGWFVYAGDVPEGALRIFDIS